LFCEHGLAPDKAVRRVQKRIEPIWRKVAGGCYLTRDIPAMIRESGFEIERLDAMYLPNSPRWSSYNFWGSARVG
jgi:hypothetical protein